VFGVRCNELTGKIAKPDPYGVRNNSGTATDTKRSP
jgi:hypothetical protein